MADRADDDAMAATRLSEGQKAEIVARFRQAESSQELAAAFGCSSATITRVVKAALSTDDYERLKAQRGRRGRVAEAPDTGAAATEAQSTLDLGPVATPAATAVVAAPAAPDPEDGPDDSPAVLAIDDADDFGDDEGDFGDDDGADADGADADGEADAFTPIPVVLATGDDVLQEPRPLRGATLPASAYMLVDKTVELQARPLAELPELGRLAPGEEERQALVMFVNPRQAKRQCGRTQRVIKMPDLSLLERTAPYLLAQGISRVVIEGALYALPGS